MSLLRRHFGSPGAHLRSVALIEGFSFVLLVFVAMPLKYGADMPLSVRIVGSAHGALFTWLGWLVVSGMRRRGHSVEWATRIMVAALLPFGPFVIDRRLRAEAAASGVEPDEKVAA